MLSWFLEAVKQCSVTLFFYHCSWWSLGPLKSLVEENKVCESTNGTYKDTSPISKMKISTIPVLPSLLVVQTVQGCPVIEHRSIKVRSGRPFSQLLLSRSQQNSTRAYWKAVCMITHKWASHISSTLSRVSYVSFLAWWPWLTSLTLSAASIKRSVKWTFKWGNLKVAIENLTLKYASKRFVIPSVLFLLASLEVQTHPDEKLK